ncbi:hypothetical protein [Gillisia sp. Hel1_33_143]|uniref:hypothetical protein n=1 Tax=Gillisia sp. Hel1_33_143 TaxID=1336796 RepID=UPI000B87ECE8|nr:hypothetical protein [Gillisia sp. Hel1_33_143]
MKIPTLKITLLLIMALTILSCNKSKPEDSLKNIDQENPAFTKSKLESEAEIKRTYCYLNEQPYKDDASKKDVLELILNITGKNVEGFYNWRPALKDQRKGSIRGTIEDNVVTANYIFTQEGREDSTSLKIILNDKEAVIEGGDTALGLNAIVTRTDCR